MEWQIWCSCRVGRPSGLPDSLSSVCHERVSADNPPATQLRPHNRRTGQSPLASHPRAHSVQCRNPSCTKCFMDSRHSISDHSLTSPTYLVDVHSVQPARMSWTYRLFDCRLSAVGHSTMLRIWMSLPADVISAETLTTFRQRLKTNLFEKSFSL